jgi:osomolarity two-component system, sensor histidine kinase SLN1
MKHSTGPESPSRYDLVFMDVQMPNVDGIQSTKLIREMGFRAPIVALTAFAEKSNEDECMASGMDYFLAKPIRRPALKQVLKKFAPIPEEEGEGSSAVVPRVAGLKGGGQSNVGSRNASPVRPSLANGTVHSPPKPVARHSVKEWGGARDDDDDADAEVSPMTSP